MDVNLYWKNVFNVNVAENYAYGFKGIDFDAPAMKNFDTRLS